MLVHWQSRMYFLKKIIVISFPFMLILRYLQLTSKLCFFLIVWKRIFQWSQLKKQRRNFAIYLQTCHFHLSCLEELRYPKVLKKRNQQFSYIAREDQSMFIKLFLKLIKQVGMIIVSLKHILVKRVLLFNDIFNINVAWLKRYGLLPLNGNKTVN